MAARAMATHSTALVTGGGTGIGAAISARLLDEGLYVYVVQRTTDDVRRAEKELCQGPYAHHVAVGAHDLATDGCATAVAACAAQFGRLDVLVNNAGVTGPTAVSRLAALDDARIDQIIDTNLKAPLKLTREALPLLSGGGVIVNISSAAAFQAQANAAAYVASKAGLVGLTKALACDLAESGVRVVCVAPGATATATSGSDDYVLERGASALHKEPPLGRAAVPDDVANAVAWLISDQAAYITGTTVMVDGGLTAF